MTFDATHVLRFVNRARAAMGLAALRELPFPEAVRADERGCLLARALACEVGASHDRAWDSRFVLRLHHPELAHAIAAATGRPANALAEVLLPEEITNLAVAFDHGWITASSARCVARGQMCFDDLRPRVLAGRHEEIRPRARALAA